jgi:hypothetical protein
MGGFYTGTDLGDKTFYGFRYNSLTGHLDVEVINDGSEVKLPQEGYIDPDDYKQWAWSQNTIDFEFKNSGHLLIRII